MKRGRSRKRSSAAKAKKPPKNFAEYLAAAPKPARSPLRKMRAAIRSAAPREATETISYRIPAFKYKGILVWFAAFSSHCSLFPTAALIDRLRYDLKTYSTSKGTIHFPLDRPLPVALIKKIVKARTAQIQSKHRR